MVLSNHEEQTKTAFLTESRFVLKLVPEP